MRGAEHIIAIRKKGLAPVLVFVDTNETGEIDDESNQLDQTSANLWIEPGDSVKRLDLRCMVGLQASVTGDSVDRVAEVSDALIRVGARRVISTVMRKVRDGEWPKFDAVSLTDTQEDYSWQA